MTFSQTDCGIFPKKAKSLFLKCVISYCSEYCLFIVLFLTGFIIYLQNNKAVYMEAGPDLF